MTSNIPLNSESESEGRPSVASEAYTAATAHIPVNSESEFEPDTETAVPAYSRGRQQLPSASHLNEPNSGDEEDPSSLQVYPPRSRSSRSRTPKGQPGLGGSRSRSRSRVSQKGKLEPRMMNSESEDASASEVDGPGGLSSLHESAEHSIPAYVAQNSGSEADEPADRKTGRSPPRARSAGLSTGEPRKLGGSRSRSRGRVPKYDVQMNSESSSDEIEGTETNYTDNRVGVEKVNLSKGLELNSESERE
ncbi:hypothetical protein [Phaffia rhodozyma]|uniref:Uncharacterized protein n=1 Tax=Phaffia rhodozyma TaxID=264483 RepID=A0A0F7SE86_PHARH|nr:hypothetical protein [Phaffia rhodozyma]